MNRILTAILVLILTSVLLIVGCSSPAPSPTPQVGKPAPDFQLPDLNGQSVSLSDFQDKSVLVNFWATWCGPCRYEMPFIQEIFEDKEWSDKGLVILAIDIGESPAKVREFMESNNFSFPVLLDGEEKIAEQYNIRGIPTTIFIDKQGLIRAMRVGAFPSKAAIEEDLTKIIP